MTSSTDSPGRFALIVLDGLGIGYAPDQAAYGDEGSDTLGTLRERSAGWSSPISSRWARMLPPNRGNVVPEGDQRLRDRAPQVGGEGQYDRTLGDVRSDSREAVSNLSLRIPAGGDCRIRAPDRTASAGKQGSLGHGDHK